MALIGVTPFVVKNMSLLIGTDDYAAAISSARFTPDQSIQTWKGGTPASVFTDMSSPTWTCVMESADDYDLTTSLWNYLNANQGQQKVCTFKPKKPASGTTQTLTATLILAAPGFGGDIDGWALSQLTHGVVGAPTFALA